MIKTQRLDALASALPYSSELRDIYRQVDVLLMATLTGSDEEGKDAWEDAMKHQPTIMTRVVEQTARELERLLRTYPVDAPNSPNQ